MITHEKLRIYEEWHGDFDIWSRSRPKEQQCFDDGDWALIDRILQTLFIVQSGLTTAEFEERARAQAREATEDDSVHERFFQLTQPQIK